MLQEKRIYSCGSLGGSRWSPALPAGVPITSEEHRVGCQHSSFILTAPVASPTARTSQWYQTPDGPGSMLASFCLITQAVTSKQAKRGYERKQGDFTATQNASMMAFWLPTSCPFTGWPRSRSPIEYTSVPNVHSTKVRGEPACLWELHSSCFR